MRLFVVVGDNVMLFIELDDEYIMKLIDLIFLKIFGLFVMMDLLLW